MTMASPTPLLNPSFYAVAHTVAGTGRRGYADGPRTTSYFDAPLDVAELPDGSLVVADGRNNCLRRVDLATGLVSTVPAQAFLGPRCPTIIDNGAAVCVCDSGHNKVRMIQFTGPEANPFASVTDVTIAGTGRAGFSDGVADTAMFDHPTGMCVAADGSILVADTKNHAVRRIAGRTGRSGLFVSTIIGNGSAGFVDGDAATARLNTPTSLAVDKYGTVFIADAGNHCVRALHPPCNGDLSASDWALTTVAGCGEAGFVDAESGSALRARFRDPSRVAVGAHGELLVCDTGNNAIRVVTAAATTELGVNTGAFVYVPSTNTLASVPEQLPRDAGSVGTRGLLGLSASSTAVSIAPQVVILRVGDTTDASSVGSGAAVATRGRVGRSITDALRSPTAARQASQTIRHSAHRTVVIARDIMRMPTTGSTALQGLPWWASAVLSEGGGQPGPMSPLVAALRHLHPTDITHATGHVEQSPATSVPARMLAATSDTHVVPYGDPARIEAVHIRYNRVMTIAGPSPRMVLLASSALRSCDGAARRRDRSQDSGAPRNPAGTTDVGAALIKAAGISTFQQASNAAAAAAEEVAVISSFERFADGAAVLEARFRKPHGLCVLSDAGGSLVVADTGNNLIRLIVTTAALESQPARLRVLLSAELVVRGKEAAAAARLLEQPLVTPPTSPRRGRVLERTNPGRGPNAKGVRDPPTPTPTAHGPAVTAEQAAVTAIVSPRGQRGGRSFSTISERSEGRTTPLTSPFRQTMGFEVVPNAFRSRSASVSHAFSSTSVPASRRYRPRPPSASLVSPTASTLSKAQSILRSMPARAGPMPHAFASVPVGSVNRSSHADNEITDVAAAAPAPGVQVQNAGLGASGRLTTHDLMATMPAASGARAQRSRRLSINTESAPSGHGRVQPPGLPQQFGASVLSPTSLHLVNDLIDPLAASTVTIKHEPATLEMLAAVDLALLRSPETEKQSNKQQEVRVDDARRVPAVTSPESAHPSWARSTLPEVSESRAVSRARSTQRSVNFASSPPLSAPGVSARATTSTHVSDAGGGRSRLAGISVSQPGVRAAAPSPAQPGATTTRSQSASQGIRGNSHIRRHSAADAVASPVRTTVGVSSQMRTSTPSSSVPRPRVVVGSRTSATTSVGTGASMSSSIVGGVPGVKRFIEELCDGRDRPLANSWVHSRDVLAKEDSDPMVGVVHAIAVADPLSAGGADAPIGSQQRDALRLRLSRFARHTASSATRARSSGQPAAHAAPAFVNIKAALARHLESEFAATNRSEPPSQTPARAEPLSTLDSTLTAADAELITSAQAALSSDAAAQLQAALLAYSAGAQSSSDRSATSFAQPALMHAKEANETSRELFGQASRRASVGVRATRPGHSASSTATLRPARDSPDLRARAAVAGALGIIGTPSRPTSMVGRITEQRSDTGGSDELQRSLDGDVATQQLVAALLGSAVKLERTKASYDGDIMSPASPVDDVQDGSDAGGLPSRLEAAEVQ